MDADRTIACTVRPNVLCVGGEGKCGRVLILLQARHDRTTFRTLALPLPLYALGSLVLFVSICRCLSLTCSSLYLPPFLSLLLSPSFPPLSLFPLSHPFRRSLSPFSLSLRSLPSFSLFALTRPLPLPLNTYLSLPLSHFFSLSLFVLLPVISFSISYSSSPTP